MFNRGWIGALLGALLVAGCSTLGLAERYNPAIGAGLNEYSKSVASFFKAQEQGGGSQAMYGSQESREFYQEAEGTLSSIILEAEASSGGTRCTAGAPVAGVLNALVSNIAGFADLQELPAVDSRYAVSLEDGSCTVVALKAVRANNRILEALHRKHGRLSPAVAELARGFTEDSIRIALTIENAKKA